MAARDPDAKQRRIAAMRQGALARQEHRTHRQSVLYGAPTTDSDPGEILLKEIRRTAGHIEWLQQQIQLSDPEMFAKSLWLARRDSGWVGPKEIDLKDWKQAAAIWVDLYLTERRHLASICRTALAAGIEERRVRLAERQAENVGTAIRGMLYDLGLDPEDEQVRSVVYKWLMQASGATDVPSSGMAIGELEG